tara:strand:- start:287 stop:1024 length:738 start_codon:yes stop_codon:yes gene_type:complete
MNSIRIIPRIDIKGEKLVKTIRLEGVKQLGDPIEYTKKYYLDGADEILLNDVVASLYERNSLNYVIKNIASNMFVPITVTGGIRSIKDVENILKSGADKVGINTAACNNPNLIDEVSKNFGASCMVLQVDAKKISENKWEPYINGGRDRTYKNLVEWIKECNTRGIGEIFLTSIDMEGTGKGFDIDLITAVSDNSDVPIIISGGLGHYHHLDEIKNINGISGIALSNFLHLQKKEISKIREYIKI